LKDENHNHVAVCLTPIFWAKLLRGFEKLQLS
jgi:hypothetical protein